MSLHIFIDYVAPLVALHQINRFRDGDIAACRNHTHVGDVGDFWEKRLTGIHGCSHLINRTGYRRILPRLVFLCHLPPAMKFFKRHFSEKSALLALPLSLMACARCSASVACTIAVKGVLLLLQVAAFAVTSGGLNVLIQYRYALRLHLLQ